MNKEKKIQINEDTWAYGNGKKLDFVVWTQKRPDRQRECVRFKITYKKLLKFLEP
jgi:hypothetical protein